jgi:hypothetical protein
MIRGGSTTYAKRFGGANAPQGHSGTGPHDIANAPAKRVQALAAAIERERVDVLGLQEYGPILHRWWLLQAVFTAILGPPNTVGAGGRETGNGLVYRPETVYALHTRWLRFWWRPSRNLPSKVAERLAFIEVLFRDLVTNGLFVVIDGHIPAARDASERTRRRINRGVIREARRLWRRFGIPVVVILDKNSASVAEYLHAGFVVVARDHVDVVLVLGAARVSDDQVVHGGPWSDRHNLVVGTAHFRKTPAATYPERIRLPRRARFFHPTARRSR